MHRNRTRLARRAHRLATAIERRGIAATYSLHDRVLSNRTSRRRFARSHGALDSTQQRLVEALNADGYVTLPVTDLFDGSTWEAIADQGRRFREDTESRLTHAGEGGLADEVKVRPGKEFVVRLHSYGAELGADDPWLAACLSPRLLDVANAYLRLWSKLEYVDLWYSVPQPVGAKRVSSQRWHRDFNDRHLLKAFLYLVDVDESMGPLQYIPGSAGSGPYAREWAWRPLGDNYPSEEELEQRIPAADIRTFTAPAGTLILVNTCGFHRGGLSTSDPRVLATSTYSSPASLASLTERSFAFTGAQDTLDAAQRYALS